jgi:hypothetical protein
MKNINQLYANWTGRGWLVCLLTAMLAMPAARAATVAWTGTGADDSLLTAENWDTQTLPTTSDYVAIDGAYGTLAGGTFNSNRLSFYTGTIDMTGGTWINNGGDFGVGVLLGTGSTASGTAVLNVSGSAWISSSNNTIYVSNNKNAELNITDNALVEGNGFYVATNNNNAWVNLSGSAVLKSRGNSYLGRNSDQSVATMTISDYATWESDSSGGNTTVNIGGDGKATGILLIKDHGTFTVKSTANKSKMVMGSAVTLPAR